MSDGETEKEKTGEKWGGRMGIKEGEGNQRKWGRERKGELRQQQETSKGEKEAKETRWIKKEGKREL